MKENFCSFTVCNVAYMYKALSLAESYLEHVGEKLTIVLFDKKRDLIDIEHLVDIVWVEEIGCENVMQLAFKYNIIEFSTSLKPYITMLLLQKYDKVIFLDPDTYLYNNLNVIVSLLDTKNIIITPHYMTPQERSVLALDKNDIGLMRFGAFNLGFFAIRKSDESLKFLKWWDERCQDLCFLETQFGLATDQKWVSIAPSLFPSLHICFHLGINVAFWNMHERKITNSSTSKKFMVNDTFELVLFHFSSFCENTPLLLTQKAFGCDLSNEISLHEVIKIYGSSLDKYKALLKDVDKRYSYDFMSDGSYISPTLRLAYASMLDSFPVYTNPFDIKGLVGLFAKKNYLLSKTASYTLYGLNNIDNNKGKLFIVTKILKLILYWIGPNSFMNLSRLFVFLSSYRMNKKLWE